MQCGHCHSGFIIAAGEGRVTGISAMALALAKSALRSICSGGTIKNWGCQWFLVLGWLALADASWFDQVQCHLTREVCCLSWCGVSFVSGG